MNEYELVISPEAIIEIKNIKYYLKHILIAPKASQDFEAKLYEKFDLLTKEPHLYPRIKTSKNIYRFACIKNYIIVFRINENMRRIEIITVTHNTCDYKERLQ